MILLKNIKSQVDNTIKYIFLSDKNILEVSYINKNDGKDIVCVPTQTTCNLGCKFCFLTGTNFPYRNLTVSEMFASTDYIISNNKKNDVLLVSFMGCGEPLLNINNVIETMKAIKLHYNNYYKVIRFAVASLVPSLKALNAFLDKVVENDLMLKFHYSLHTPNKELRKELMPAACNAEDVIPILNKYKINVEFHYSLMNDVNDTEKDVDLLLKLNKSKLPIKIIKLSEKKSIDLIGSNKVNNFRKMLEEKNIITEYYEPPGSDIGASCGQFLLDYYNDYNKGK